MVARILSGFGVVCALACVATASAQDKSTYYTVRNPKEFKINWAAFYDKADELTAATRQKLPHKLDLAYGSDPKQKVDVYMPAQKTAPGPVFIFLHGGGFREGDRAHYGFVSRPFAARGAVTVVASYRLTPAARFPDQPDDVRQIVAWTFRNITPYGGDPSRIYVGGHSAGAILAASVGLDNGWTKTLGLPSGVIKGIVPVSGPYDLRNNAASADYVGDPARAAEASPLLHVMNPPPISIIGVGSVEPYVTASNDLAAAIRARGGRADVIVLDAADHARTALALGDASSPLVSAIVRAMDR